MTTFGNDVSTAAKVSKFWAVQTTYASGWNVAFDANQTGNSVAFTLNKARSVTGPTNKVTPWSTAAKIGVSTDISKGSATVSSLTVHPSVITYGWTIVTMTKADLQSEGIKGSMLTANNTSYKVRVEADIALNKVSYVGIGASNSIYLSWKLKSVKR